jgi:tRNA(adenine34) deaminase
VDDVQLMTLALAQAEIAARAGEVPVGAVLMSRDGSLLVACHNRREMDQDPTAHAEMLAIRQAAQTLGRWRLTETVLAVTLEPCLMCAGAIILARIDRLIYGASDPKGGAVHTLFETLDDARLNHQVTVQGGILAGASRDLLQDFFRARRGLR